ncbi:MAG: extracellular solute-binding protein [Clostridia bacterium]|nr:extracellular solute-binding protein [Clostridia bacterium]
MKTFKKIFCLILSLGLVASACACTPGNKTEGKKGTLSIASFEGGYGATWAQALADAYKVHNPEAEVEVDCNPLVREDAVTAFQTNITSVDLYFIDGLSIGNYCETYQSLADISEVYNSTPKAGSKEEDILIKDKIRPEIIPEMMYSGDQAEYQNKYYTIPSPSGPCSLILNTDALDNVFGEGNWSEPRTTDELFALCDAIAEKKAQVNIAGVNYTIYPFIYSGEALEYWRYLYYPWIAQYSGIDAWNEMITVKKNGVYDQSAYQPDGKLQAYQKLEKLIKRSNGYCDGTSMNNKFNQSQKYFLQGRACMYITGDWLEREMEGSTDYKAELKMVKTPITSDLSAKLESEYGVSLGATAAEKDQTLANVISAIDNGQTSYESVSAQVFNAVKQARAITFTLANSAIGAVPAVSVNKDMVIDFLRFMYSDEGIEIILRESKSYLPVVNASEFKAEGELSLFRESVNQITEREITYIFTSSRDPIRYRAGLDQFIGNEYPETALGKKTGAITAKEYLEKEARLLNEKWAEYMKVL